MGYHKKVITKGTFGNFSKIQEEFDELTDAIEQNDKILIMCELSDLIGAIEGFANKHYNLKLDDLISFSNKTQSAFLNGYRK